MEILRRVLLIEEMLLIGQLAVDACTQDDLEGARALLGEPHEPMVAIGVRAVRHRGPFLAHLVAIVLLLLLLEDHPAVE